MAELARYANPALLSGLGIRIPTADEARADPYVGARDIAAQFLERGVSYGALRFRPQDQPDQTILTPGQLLAGTGTCLDFAVATAAACVAAGIPTMIALLHHPDGEHAFVVAPGAGWDFDKEEPVQLIDGPDLAASHGHQKMRIIEATPTTELPDQRSMQSGRRALDSSRRATLRLLRSPRSKVFLVHVQAATVEENPQYIPPPLGQTAAVTAYLPEQLKQLDDYPSRREASTHLARADGIVVLLGPSGVGKSTLALERARKVAGGRGWWLEASDRQVLRTAFAAAEAHSRGERLRNRLADTVTTYVAEARRRLTSSRAPWVVVFDNADGPPEQVIDLVPPPVPGQLVIITTTNTDWEANAQAPGWVLVEVPLLDAGEIDREHGWHLPEAMRLPGVATIAAANLGAWTGQVRDASHLLQLALGAPDAFASKLREGHATELLLVAAALSSPEDVRETSLTNAFAGMDVDVQATLPGLVQRGLLEQSRRAIDIRSPQDRVFWMHRLVRDAFWDLYLAPSDDTVDVATRILTQETAAVSPPNRSTEDLQRLAMFLGVSVATTDRPTLFTAAVTSLLNQLEPRGGDCITAAEALGRRVLPDMIRLHEPPRTRGIVVAGIARSAIQGTPSFEEIEDALALVEAVIAELTEEPLTRGRLEAVRGILLQRQARLIRPTDPIAADSLVHDAITTLEKSYRDRADALGWDWIRMQWKPLVSNDDADEPADTFVDGRERDPEQHVDRAWYNLGGAFLTHGRQFLTGGSEDSDLQLRDSWTASLSAYAGSLALRPGDDMYTAASAWGSALILYMAAVNNVKLDLRKVLLTRELDRLQVDDRRSHYLLAAEDLATVAHRIRQDLTGPFSGDTQKTRALLFKIGLAWMIAEREPPLTDEVLAAVRKILTSDLEETRR